MLCLATVGEDWGPIWSVPLSGGRGRGIALELPSRLRRAWVGTFRSIDGKGSGFSLSEPTQTAFGVCAQPKPRRVCRRHSVSSCTAASEGSCAPARFFAIAGPRALWYTLLESPWRPVVTMAERQ